MSGWEARPRNEGQETRAGKGGQEARPRSEAEGLGLVPSGIAAQHPRRAGEAMEEAPNRIRIDRPASIRRLMAP